MRHHHFEHFFAHHRGHAGFGRFGRAFMEGGMGGRGFGMCRKLGSADLQDPRYVALTRKFRYRPDPAAGDRTRWSGDVTIVLDSGERLNHRVPDMRGTPRNPFSMQELVDKFLHNATGVLRPVDAEQAVDRILKLETAEDLEPVFQPLSTTI